MAHNDHSTSTIPAGNATSGIREVDRLIGGVMAGDNIVWEVDSGAPVANFVSAFVAASGRAALPSVYVSFNRSPQTINGEYAALVPDSSFTLVDCFASGKGNGDKVFLDFFATAQNKPEHHLIHVKKPETTAGLQDELIRVAAGTDKTGTYVFDSLTGMFDLWGDEDKVLRFFGHFCPRLYDLNAIAYWLIEKDAHSEAFLAKVRHITQVVLEADITRGLRTLTVRKAASRQCPEIGVPQQFDVHDGQIVISEESREGRELGLLTRMGEVLGSALEPSFFFERTMETLAAELGMTRGTLVLLDKTSNKLKIAAAHGLSNAERGRGEYAVGEGVTGHVVKTGTPEVIPDISRDSRFLDRTVTRRADPSSPIAFICVPLKLDGEVAGALSVDRPFAVEPALEKDLRLLSIVASIVAQVLKINRMIQLEKEEILVLDRKRLRDLSQRYRLDNVVGESNGIQRVLSAAATAAKSRASILVTGETGTGKELIANVVHYNSGRSTGPLVKVNCGALPETLLESELFGHVRGAFTGALRDRKGRFELADGGTLFLDEVAEMSPRLQVKLLRVLQEKEFEPVGGARTVSVDVRVVAATNKDLKQEMAQGRFRNDLYYRLNVVPIHLPPLRERREDIPLLVDRFLEKYNSENEKHVSKMSREVLDQLLDYPWPGNVRELENCIEHAVVMSDGEAIVSHILPADIVQYEPRKEFTHRRATGDIADVRNAAERFCTTRDDLAEAREQLSHTVEETVIRLGISRGMTQRELAERIGMSRMTLRKRIREYRL